MKKPTRRKSRVPKDAVVTFTPAPRIAGLDDYDLPPQIDLDTGKAKRNPYAGCVKFSHGGKRQGAGRKRAPEPIENHSISLYKSHVTYLRRLDPNLSRAIRKLIETKSQRGG